MITSLFLLLLIVVILGVKVNVIITGVGWLATSRLPRVMLHKSSDSDHPTTSNINGNVSNIANNRSTAVPVTINRQRAIRTATGNSVHTQHQRFQRAPLARQRCHRIRQRPYPVRQHAVTQCQRERRSPIRHRPATSNVNARPRVPGSTALPDNPATTPSSARTPAPATASAATATLACPHATPAPRRDKRCARLPIQRRNQVAPAHRPAAREPP